MKKAIGTTLVALALIAGTSSAFAGGNYTFGAQSELAKHLEFFKQHSDNR